MPTPLRYDASLDAYEEQAVQLFDALQLDDHSARWRVKWEHPRFRGRPVDDVRPESVDVADAQMVVAREYGFEDWAHLVEFTRLVRDDGSVARFEAAAEAVVSGDLEGLLALLREYPELVRARSTRRHHATLLHYVAANGVEGARQKTPRTAVAVARLLLDAGAGVDALADMYDEKCTTLSMLVSSTPPANAGLQVALAETLLDHGAALTGPGSKWRSALLTALAFGFRDTAEALAGRFRTLDNLPEVAGLGRVDDTVRLLLAADAERRHIALALAAQHGHAEVVRVLLDAGEDPSRYNPDGYHSHGTPLHHAVWNDQMDVVRLLVDRGARLDIKDTIYGGTPLGWALYGGRAAIADYLRSRGAPAE